jgi:hypothetical protein
MQWKEAAALAEQQFGLLAAWQAAGFGITHAALVHRVKEHGWRRVRRGVYQMPAHALPPRAQLKAAELAFVGDGVAAARAGAFAWELLPRLHKPLDFIVPMGCTRRPSGTRVRESGWLATNEPTVRNGIWVPTVEWTILTCGPWSPVSELKRMISLADQKRLCTPSQVKEVVASAPKAKGRRNVVTALRALESGGLTHSELEALGRRRLRAAGLHPHGRPHLVLDEAQARVGEIDIAFIDEQVGIPIDGPHHFEPAQKRADDDQRHKLRLMGWILVPADEHRLTYEPDIFIRQVRAALRARGAQPSGPLPGRA